MFCLCIQLCSLVSLQRYTKALSSVQRASLVEKSRQKPPERIRVVTDVEFHSTLVLVIFNYLLLQIYCLLIFQALRSYRYDEDPLLVACGISIEKQLTQVDGRVLEAPKVRYLLSLDGLCNSKQFGVF